MLEKDGRKFRRGCVVLEVEEEVAEGGKEEQLETLGTPRREKFWVTKLEREKGPPIPPPGLVGLSGEVEEGEETVTDAPSEGVVG